MSRALHRLLRAEAKARGMTVRAMLEDAARRWAEVVREQGLDAGVP
jgi:hypothetical protein